MEDEETRDTKPCDTCNGHGAIPNPDMDTRDPFSPDSFKCDDCGGDGFVYI